MIFEGITFSRTSVTFLLVLLWIEQICCTVTNQGSLTLPEPPHCAIQLSDRISGQNTNIVEHPWTALIEYQKQNGSLSFHCGGSLINERYIVTAAHCIKSIAPNTKVHRVRLGEWDKAREGDCQEDFCSSPPIDLDVEQIVVHPNYNISDPDHANDIALIRFTRQVHYSDTVRPICLPLSNSLRERNHAGSISFAAGWHDTYPVLDSKPKRKVELNVTSLEECSKIYKKSQITLKPTQMCAGKLRSRDSCPGDSGSALMRQIAEAWYQIGVFSFGPKRCATTDLPDVYTNVAEYVDWIKENVY